MFVGYFRYGQVKVILVTEQAQGEKYSLDIILIYFKNKGGGGINA